MKWYISDSNPNIFVTGYTGITAIVSIKEDNKAFDRETSILGMAASSYYHDLNNQLVYIWPADSSNPNSNGKTYMFYIWIGICDSQAEFEIQGEKSIFYFPAIDSKNTPPFSQQINELFKGDITFQYGEIKLKNPEWGYYHLNDYIFINSTAVVKTGADDAAYGAYTSVLWGLIENVTFSNAGVTLSVKDIRDRLYSTIPPDRFLLSDFPYRPEAIAYRTRPVLVGEKTGMQPNLISSITDTYEISQTVFTFGSFAIESIDAVYKDGVLLSTPADYSEDLANGRFTLTASPGTSTMTCDAKGLKITRNFSTKAWSNTYSYNIADITFFFLKLQNIEDSYLKESTFLTLQTNSTGIQCGDLVNQEVDFKEKLKELQTTGRFHLLPTADGQIEVISYRRSDAPSIQLTNEYYTDFVIKRDVRDILNRVLIRYDKNPVYIDNETEGGEALADFQYNRRVKDSVGHKYQVIKMSNFKTIINNEGDAENLGNDFISLYERPTETISFKTNHEAIGWQLLDKIGITYTELLKEILGVTTAVETTIYNEEPFILIAKSIAWNGYITLTLRKDPATIKGRYWTDHDGAIITDHTGAGITT
jgi:hypothetical protein